MESTANNNAEESTIVQNTTPSEEAKQPKGSNASSKTKKVNKEKDMRHLNSIFKKADEKTIWSAYKQSGYDLSKAMEQLCQLTGEKLEDVKKKLDERKAKGKVPEKKEEDNTPQKGSRMKTAEEVVKRIKWDSKFDPDDFIIGYEDRFAGIMETKLSTFEKDVSSETFIPWHRVVYFKQSDTIVWDRRSRLDNIFLSTTH